MNKEESKKEDKKEISWIKTGDIINRQIIIETDGNNINLVKNEAFGSLELSAILMKILNKIQ